jgi:predicted metal-dependent phosphoesterase TrpH
MHSTKIPTNASLSHTLNVTTSVESIENSVDRNKQWMPEDTAPTQCNADLHCHSVVSDGTLTPEELALRAKTNGVELWSLTDHDELGGQQRAMDAAQAIGLPYVTGVEISVTFAHATVHIVGLGFDAQHPIILEGLAHTRGGRSQRAKAIALELEKVGIVGAFEGALRFAGNPDLISRTHFSRFLIEKGICKDHKEVFRKYLTEKKPGYVPHTWANMKDAVGWIVQSGGVAVVAHPARYGFSPNEEFALFSEFKAHGGRGVEVITGSHTPAEAMIYAGVAKEFGLLASRGSDFHSPTESRIDLGTWPFLTGDLQPVWSVLQNSIVI